MGEAVITRPLTQCMDALASTHLESVEAAKEAIAAAGRDALPALLRALDADDERLRLRSLSLLALLADRAITRRLLALLHDPSARIRQHTAMTLARTAGPGVLPALSRVVAREEDTSVRVAALRALVRLVQTGHDEALRPVLDRLSDPAEEVKVRLVALEVLPWLPDTGAEGSARDALLARLASDPSRAVAARARRLIASPPRARLEPWAIDKLLEDLGNERLAQWRQAVSRLCRVGGSIVEPLMQALCARAGDREYARRCTLVLKSLSPRQLAKLGPYVDPALDPTVLTTVIDVIADAGSRALNVKLAALVTRLGEHGGDDLAPAYEAVRQKGHAALARAGSRLAANDLRRLLEDRRISLRIDCAEAIALVGTRLELGAVVKAYRRSRGMTRLALRDAMLSLVRREKIRRTDRALCALEPSERRAVLEILGLPVRGGRQRKWSRPRMVGMTGPLLHD